MATTKGLDLNQVLAKIDNFATSNQVERVRLLAAAVVPYGLVEDSSKKIPEIYREIKSIHKGSSIPLFTRLLRKAGVEPRYVSMLDSFLPATGTTETTETGLCFTELLVTVSDHLGNNDYLRKLTNRIPEEKLGSTSERIKSSVQLFQRLLHEDTLSLQRKKESLDLLSRWLSDIGRRDIAKLVEEAKQNQPPSQEQGILVICCPKSVKCLLQEFK